MEKVYIYYLQEESCLQRLNICSFIMFLTVLVLACFVLFQNIYERPVKFTESFCSYEYYSKYRRMNSESLSAPLFSPLDQKTAASIRNRTVSFQSSCSLKQDCHTQHRLTLIGQTFLLEQQGTFSLALPLTFDVKFEVLHQIQKDVHSQKIGIRLYDELERQLKIYIDNGLVEQWCLVLGSRLNRKGFHQMFKPIRKLGKGNFATVYEAQKLSDKTKYAVKAFLKQNFFNTKHGKDSLINQLTILRELNRNPHPNIIKMEGVYESDNSIYVVLELLPGKTLFQVMQDRNGYFSCGQIKGLMQGLMKGLRHMHANRIMHRDLKPENIMLRGDSLEPVIVDFGLATHADIHQYIFFRCGTPGYVAPEIMKLTESVHVEPVCDIFSLGAVFHLLLSKKTLFPGTKFEEVYTNNKEFNMDLDGDHLQSISPCAKQLLKKMLKLDPRDRITAVEALNHPYFSEQAEEQGDFKSSPVLTSAGSSKVSSIKRMGLLFY